MATMSKPIDRSITGATETQTKAFPRSSLRFDYLYAVLTIVFVIGIFLDGWAHNHGKVDNTFFTPWHGVLYGSVVLIAVMLTGTYLLNLRKGHSMWRAVPKGYTLSLVGVILFFIGGGFDFVWHSLFGFEASLETLISPAHTLLATSAFLFVTGPLRSAWLRAKSDGWRGLFPAIVSLTIVLSLLTFFTQFANFLGNPEFMTPIGMPDSEYLGTLTGIVSVLIASTIIIGVILLTIRRWRLPFGALTLMLTANSALMCWMRYRDEPYLLPIVGTAFVGGLLADLLLRFLKPTAERPAALRLFAFIVPFALSLLYFLVIISAAGTYWRVHLWLGTAVFAGIAGLLLSYLTVPPALPIEQE